MMSSMVDSPAGRAPRPSSGLDMAGLGARLRMERLRRRLSLHDLEARTGVSRSMLSEVERGSKVPTVLVLDRIATGLDTSIARLLGGILGGISGVHVFTSRLGGHRILLARPEGTWAASFMLQRNNNWCSAKRQGVAPHSASFFCSRRIRGPLRFRAMQRS